MVVPKPQNLEATTTQSGDDASPRKSRITWARLLKRVFNIDFKTCNLCGGNMKIIAAIEDPNVIKKILSHLGLPTKAPTPWPARGPPPAFDDHQQLPEFDLM
jgi:hypothetical protein